jgi:hypothetical protein
MHLFSSGWRTRTLSTAIISVAALGFTASPAAASEAVLNVGADCTGLVTATATVQSTEGVTGTIDGWWGDALGQPATRSTITLQVPNGTQVSVGVNMTLSTGAPSSAVVTVTVPDPCPTPTTTTVADPTTTVAEPTTTTSISTTIETPPPPTPTTTVLDCATTTGPVEGCVTPTSPSSWPEIPTRPTIDLGGRKRWSCPPGQTEQIIEFDDRLPTDVPLPGSGKYVRCGPMVRLPATGATDTALVIVPLAAFLTLCGVLLVMAASYRRKGRR